ncbi:MAG: hypothetical protein LIP18_04590 [Planctomycetes bacterium]|nr:hypothetical protein [Planctomycetota bacterium]
MENHDGEGVFPLYPKGTLVSDLTPCPESRHWYGCTLDGRHTYIPDACVENGALVAEYNPTELVVKKGDRIEVKRIVYEWVYGTREDGVSGLIPAEKVLSIDE